MYPSESNNLSLVLKVTFGGDAATIKHDLSQDVVRRKRPRSQDSVQNHHRPPSPQHSRQLNKELSPAGNVQGQISSAVEVDDAGPQIKSTSRTSLGLENQHLVEKDSTSHGSPESSTNFNQ